MEYGVEFFDSFLPTGSVNIVDGNGESVLFIAIREDRYSIAEMLITQRNCDVNIRNFRGETPLFVAVYLERLNIISLLLEGILPSE